MKFIVSFLMYLFILLSLSSCKKTGDVEQLLIGSWERVCFDHNGKEKWIFTDDNKILIVLSLDALNILDDTVSSGSYTTEIVRYSHGTLFNKNIFTVPAITITGFENYKYNNGQENIYYPAYNTVWEIHKLKDNTLIITTDKYDGKTGGLEIREFYK